MSDDEDKNTYDPTSSVNQGSVITSVPRMTPNRMVRTMPVETDRDKEYLTLKVVRPSNQQEVGCLEIHFRVKRTTQMGKLKRSYSERLGVHVTSLRFLYDGRRISDEATPGTLEMESGDYIEVYKELGVSPLETVEVNITDAYNPNDWSPRPNSPFYDDRDYDMDPALPPRDNQSRSLPNIRSSNSHVNNSASDNVELDTGVSVSRRRVGEEREPKHNKRVKLSNLSSETNTSVNIEPSGCASASDHEINAKEELNDVKKQLSLVTKKYEDLVKKLRDKVECPVCFEVPKSAPVPVCPNGHVVCMKCVRDTCPTCRVRMANATSTLAVTVIENIEHMCEHDGCEETRPISELASHQARCPHRSVRCPGLDCNTRVKLTSLVSHVVPCCVERAEIRVYKLPHKFSYMMNEDLKNLSGESQNFNWKLEGVKFDEKVFFLKVTRKARTGRWFFYVQIVGSDTEAADYTADITVFRPDIGPAGKYSQRYSGDVCPIDVDTVDGAEEGGYCLTLKDGAMAKFFLRNEKQENEFSVHLNISKV